MQWLIGRAVMRFQHGSGRFDDVRDSGVNSRWNPFSDCLVSLGLLVSGAIEMSDGNIENVARVMGMNKVDWTYTLGCTTVLILIQGIEEETTQFEVISQITFKKSFVWKIFGLAVDC